MMTTTAQPLTVNRANAEAWQALRAVNIEPQAVISTEMGYQPFLGGRVIETEARVTFDQMAAAAAVLDALPGAKGCECLGVCATVYRRVRP